MDITELNRMASAQHSPRHPWETARVRVIRWLLKRKDGNAWKHLTDIGAGDAYVIETLAHHSTATKYTAIDTAYSPELIRQLQLRTEGLPINFLPAAPPAHHPDSDVAMLADVIEHCADDAAVLRETVRNVLQPGAELLITVPAFQGLFSQHDQLLLHYRRYTRKQLVMLCQKENLEIVSSGYFFFTLLPPRLVRMLGEKAGWWRTRQSIDNWKGGRLVSGIISTILWFDFRISRAFSAIGIHLPGLSCYCLCKKRLS